MSNLVSAWLGRLGAIGPWHKRVDIGAGPEVDDIAGHSGRAPTGDGRAKMADQKKGRDRNEKGTRIHREIPAIGQVFQGGGCGLVLGAGQYHGVERLGAEQNAATHHRQPKEETG